MTPAQAAVFSDAIEYCWIAKNNVWENPITQYVSKSFPEAIEDWNSNTHCTRFAPG